MWLEWAREKRRRKEKRGEWASPGWRVAVFLQLQCAQHLLLPVSSGWDVPEAPQGAGRMYPLSKA